MNFNKCAPLAVRTLIWFAIISTTASTASAEWKEKVLYSFQGIPDGAYPAGGVVFDQAGNLYGATTYGGANDCPGITQCGVVFQLQPPVQKGGAWTEHVLYVFKGVNSNDGDAPVGGVIFDQSGNLYGTTAYGGTGNCMLFGGRVGCGTVYELVPPKQKGGAWTEQVVYSFQSGNDGYFPWGDLTFDSAGNLYGATQYGGGYGSCNAPYYQFCGTVFKMSAPKTKGGKWTEQVLYAFKSGKDGANPNGGLVFDSKGTIYGTTAWGGTTTSCVYTGFVGCGTVFKLQPAHHQVWGEKVLYRFSYADGAGPNGGLIFRDRSHLYGTTVGGGSHEDGVTFQMEPRSGKGSWKETLTHVFTGGTDGSAPVAGLILGSDGSSYGTSSGSPSRGGLVFRMKPSTSRNGRPWDMTVVYSFSGSPDGYDPVGVILQPAGALYGTTLYGGTSQACRGGCGIVFEIKP